MPYYFSLSYLTRWWSYLVKQLSSHNSFYQLEEDPCFFSINRWNESLATRHTWKVPPPSFTMEDEAPKATSYSLPERISVLEPAITTQRIFVPTPDHFTKKRLVSTSESIYRWGSSGDRLSLTTSHSSMFCLSRSATDENFAMKTSVVNWNSVKSVVRKRT